MAEVSAAAVVMVRHQDACMPHHSVFTVQARAGRAPWSPQPIAARTVNPADSLKSFQRSICTSAHRAIHSKRAELTLAA